MSLFSDLIGGTPLEVFQAYAAYDRNYQNTPTNPANMQWDSTSYLSMQKDLIDNQQKVINALSGSGSVSNIVKNPIVWIGLAVVVGGFLLLRK